MTTKPKKKPGRTSKAKSAKTKLSTDKRPKYKKTHAISLRLPHEEVVEGEKPKFYITYVQNSGKAVVRPCTHKVWKDVNTEELFRKFRYEFEIFEDAQTGEVQHINAKIKKEHLPAGFNEADIADSDVTEEPRFVEVVISPDDKIKVARAPSDCRKSTEDEIIDSISENADVKSGDYLLGTYRIEEIREREGHKTIFVDTKIDL